MIRDGLGVHYSRHHLIDRIYTPMNRRITRKFLEAQCETLNRITNSPEQPWDRSSGRAVGQIGNYHISGAYGGYSLHRTTNEGGAVDDVLSCGHIKARELSERISAYTRGLEHGNK